MIVRNLGTTNLSFEVGGKKYHLGPKGSVGYASDQALVDASCADDPTVAYMVGREMVAIEDAPLRTPEPPAKTVRVVSEREAEAERTVEVPNSGKDASVMKVVKADREVRKRRKVVPCAATTAAGNPCAGKVYVDEDDFDPDVPYFCTRHKAQRPEDYEKTESGWRKKA